MSNCQNCENYKPKQIVELTEFQKLIVDCEPKKNKPVFVLSGCGSGKTFALNQRAIKDNFLYYRDISPGFLRSTGEYYNIRNIHTNFQGYEEVVFEGYSDPNLILRLIPHKKLIVFTNGVDFVADFANKLKGEYIIISGFNVDDNPYLENTQYRGFLSGLPGTKDRKRYFCGDWEDKDD